MLYRCLSHSSVSGLPFNEERAKEINFFTFMKAFSDFFHYLFSTVGTGDLGCVQGTYVVPDIDHNRSEYWFLWYLELGPVPDSGWCGGGGGVAPSKISKN